MTIRPFVFMSDIFIRKTSFGGRTNVYFTFFHVVTKMRFTGEKNVILDINY